jgi:Protein of unknown function (DUF3025)
LSRLNCGQFPDCADLNHLVAQAQQLMSGGGVPIQFVDATVAQSAGGPGYEESIFQTGQVPTRPSDWHDFFNALAWLTFPRSKEAINRAHVGEIRRQLSRDRGRLRDLLSLFDEGGIVVACADNTLAQLLRDYAWRSLFCDHRDAVKASTRCYVFGHAVLEKGVMPYRGVTGKALIVPVDPGLFEQAIDVQMAALDVFVAEALAQSDVATLEARLTPLPILGIPGWCEDNEDPKYYDDTQQFRPHPRLRAPHLK